MGPSGILPCLDLRLHRAAAWYLRGSGSAGVLQEDFTNQPGPRV